MTYRADPARYDTMQFRNTGKWGLKLPAISLGLWQNFGGNRDYPSAFEILGYAFDHGVTHFDLANNYGPPPGAAEELFGQVMARDFRPYRDELIISSKAGWGMWPGPYGDFGSRKYVIASAEQSLKRMGLEYVDIFYSHRFDPNTPLEETMSALEHLYRSGKALYVGISSYPAEQTRQAHKILQSMGVPLLIHQPSYSVLNRWIEDEDDTIGTCGKLGIGVIPFSPARAGHPLGQVLERHQGHAGRGEELLDQPQGAGAECPQGRRRPRRDRQEARPDAGPARAGLGAAAQGGDLGADRRAHARAAQGLPRRAGQPRSLEGRAHRDRQGDQGRPDRRPA